jgi:LEA14-like dessication related protein
MNRLSRAALIPFAAIALAMGLTSCAFLQQVVQPPTVSFNNASFRAADWESLQVDLHFDLHNPNSVGVRLSGYAMKFAVEGLTLLDGEVNKPLDLRGGATTDLVLPVKIKWKELGAKLLDSGSVPDSLAYTASGDMKFNTPIGLLAIPFSKKGKIPVIKPPRVRPVGIRVQKASLTSVKLAIDFEISNGTAKAMSLAGFDHSLKLNGLSVLQGSIAKPVKVEGGKKSRQSLVVNLSMAKVAGALGSVLMSGGNLTVALAGKAKVDTGFGKIPWTYNASKSLSLAR